ncbi:hypothetical protein HDU98_005381 [Podochytrium sp. JEL0797]|nr:hypothetical protein HDU98_005381 [Podochytrium sp. JEL0797]
MVLFQIPAIPGAPQFTGATVSLGIHIEGEPHNSPEYPFEDNDPAKSYVESKIGKQYSVQFTSTLPAPTFDSMQFKAGRVYLRGDVVIDGTVHESLYLYEHGDRELVGKRQNGGRSPFVFSAPSIVATGGMIDKDVVDKLGTIEISLWPVQMEMAKPTLFNNTARGITDRAPEVNERAKKGAFVSATTRLGPAKPEAMSVRGSNRLTLAPILVHTFHYKTRDFLEVEGIIPDANPIPSASAPEKKVKLESNQPKPIAASGGASNDVGSSSKRSAEEDDDEVEFVGVQPQRKKVVELIDLTGDD